MELTTPWLLWLAPALLIIALGLGLWRGTRPPRNAPEVSGIAVTRSARLRALPGFERALRRRSLALISVLLVGVIALGLAAVLAARPTVAKTVQPINTNRDIMLCLDVSGSMTDVDSEVVETFQRLVTGFTGERIGMTIFNSSSVQIFPLTDDYTYVQRQLRTMLDSFNSDGYEIPDHWRGTLNGAGASLIGDGLAACAMRFDNLDTERSRSIIVSTDNEAFGASIVSLQEAAAYAAERSIRVYALNPVDDSAQRDSIELRAAAESTGGAYYPLREATAVDDIITRVNTEQARELRGDPQIIRADDPAPFAVALFLAGLAFLGLLWRFRL